MVAGVTEADTTTTTNHTEDMVVVEEIITGGTITLEGVVVAGVTTINNRS